MGVGGVRENSPPAEQPSIATNIAATTVSIASGRDALLIRHLPDGGWVGWRGKPVGEAPSRENGAVGLLVLWMFGFTQHIGTGTVLAGVSNVWTPANDEGYMKMIGKLVVN